MALPSPNYWHISSAGWTAVTPWAAGTVQTVGQIVRQLAGVAVGSERTFICIVAGTTHATTEPTWNTGQGTKTTDNTVTWIQANGYPAINGNLRDTYSWTAVKSLAISTGYIISDIAQTNYFICSTAGTAGGGAEPSWNTTPGATTADNTITWTCIGPVGNFTTAYGAPSATLALPYLAAYGSVAGDTFWMADNHAETRAAALTLTSPGTAANPCYIYCVDHTVASPTAADIVSVPTGSITTTGNSGLVFNGIGYYQGIIFSCGSGAVAALINVNSIETLFKTCSLRKLGTTGTASAITLNCNWCVLDNTSVQFGATADRLNFVGNGLWKNTPNAVLGATFPATLISDTAAAAWLVDGVDISALAAGQTICLPGSNCKLQFTRLKLGAGAVLATTPAVPGSSASFVQCDSGATNYTQALSNYQGTLTQETTIVRSGGASDGTTPLSWKLVSTANSKWISPFESFPIPIWNDTVGSSVTATVEIVAAGALNNDDAWLVIEYMGSTLTPQGSFASNTKANNLATGTALPTSTATWASSPGFPQKLVVTFTPQMKGYIFAYVYLAKLSQTLYADPLVTLS